LLRITYNKITISVQKLERTVANIFLKLSKLKQLKTVFFNWKTAIFF